MEKLIRKKCVGSEHDLRRSKSERRGRPTLLCLERRHKSVGPIVTANRLTYSIVKRTYETVGIVRCQPRNPSSGPARKRSQRIPNSVL